MVNVLEAFTERFNSIQRDFAEMKARPEPKPPGTKEAADLAARIDEMEAALERISERKDPKAPRAAEPREMKAFLGRISGLEDRVGQLTEKTAALDNISKLKGLKEQLSPEAAAPGNADSRIAAMGGKVAQVGNDVQRLSEYFLDGMKHMESRIRSLEARLTEREGRWLLSPEKEGVTKEGSWMIEGRRQQTPSSHLPASSRQPRPQAGGWETKPRFRTSYDFPSAPPGGEIQEPAMAPPPRREAADVQLPAALPPPEPPATSTIFTRLRESTVIRRPPPQADDEDLDIIMEHIRESLRRSESRDKITRDLTNAGYDDETISRAFMQVRAG
jgi:hypothetical protein